MAGYISVTYRVHFFKFFSFLLSSLFCILFLLNSGSRVYAQDRYRSFFTVDGKTYSRGDYPNISYGILSEYGRIGEEYWKELYDFYKKISDKREELYCRPEALKGFCGIDELKSYYQSSFSHPDRRVRDYFKDTFIVQISMKNSVALLSDSILTPFKGTAQEQYKYMAAMRKQMSLTPYGVALKAVVHSVENHKSDLSLPLESGQDIVVFSLCTLYMEKNEQRYILVKPLSKNPREVEFVMPHLENYQDPFYDFMKERK